MVTWSESDAYRERNRNRRTVVLDGTLESGDTSNASLTASDAGLDTIETVTLETPVVGAGNALASYSEGDDRIDFYDQDLSDNTTTLTDDVVTVVVTGTVE